LQIRPALQSSVMHSHYLVGQICLTTTIHWPVAHSQWSRIHSLIASEALLLRQLSPPLLSLRW
jgi:hypothetical protein